jgi:hypothetical protein
MKRSLCLCVVVLGALAVSAPAMADVAPPASPRADVAPRCKCSSVRGMSGEEMAGAGFSAFALLVGFALWARRGQ